MPSSESLGGGRLPPAPVLRYYAFRASQRAGFTVPIFVLFFTGRGLSLAQVGVLEALWTVTVLVCETPTGYLGDRLGRRRGLAVGTLLAAAGSVAFVFAHTFAAFAAVIVLRGIAATFKSGTDAAWLYDTLRERAAEDRYAHVAGRAGAVGRVTHGGAALVGAPLFALDPTWPWLVEGAVGASGVLVLATVSEPSRRSGEPAGDDPDDAGPDNPDPRPDLRRALGQVRKTLGTREVCVFVALVGLLTALLNTVEIFVQPTSVEVVGIDPAHLGVLYAGFTLVAAAMSARVGWLQARVGVRRWFLAAPAVLGVVLVAVAVAPVLAIPAFVLARAVSAGSGPLAGQYLNDRTASEGRATVLSAASTVRSAVTAPMNVLGGALATALALPVGLGILGGVLLVGTAVGLVAWRPAVGADAAGDPT